MRTAHGGRNSSAGPRDLTSIIASTVTRLVRLYICVPLQVLRRDQRALPGHGGLWFNLVRATRANNHVAVV